VVRRAAIVHYWLLHRRGGEKVPEALCRLLPGPDIFALFCDPATLSPELRKHKITTSFLNPARRWHRELLPLMPMALESFDLRGYDLVISSESAPAKGRGDALKCCLLTMKEFGDRVRAPGSGVAASGRWRQRVGAVAPAEGTSPRRHNGAGLVSSTAHSLT
jgi:hypothetical protein